MKFKVGDIVFVSNPDTDYEEEYGHRYHKNFFGKVIEVEDYGETVVTVEFERDNDWAYLEEELSLASEIKDMTIEEFSNRFGVLVTAEYL